MIRVLLVDDHAYLREGIEGVLSRQPDMEVVGAAANGKDAFTQLAETPVDVLVTDQSMPEMDGLSLVRLVAKDYPATRVVVLTMHEESYLFREMQREGVAGYVLKSDPAGELPVAIRAVMRGETYCSAAIKVGSSAEPAAFLTPRERDVLQLVVEGQSNEQIADSLYISKLTVETHRKNIFAKTEAGSLVDLVNFARDNGLVSKTPPGPSHTPRE